MDILRKFKIYCATEGKFIETWKMTTPTTCPTDYRHEIDESQTQEVERKYVESANVQNVFLNSISYQNTYGYYMLEGRQYQIPSGPQVYTEDFTLPTTQSVYGMRICGTHNHVGDKFSIILNPDTVIGVVLGNATQGSTEIITNNTVYENIIPGFYVQLGQNEYLVKSKLSNGILLNTPLSEDINSMTPVILVVYIVKNYTIECEGNIKAGYGSMGSKPLPAGTVVRIKYTNNSNEEKLFYINYEYSY